MKEFALYSLQANILLIVSYLLYSWLLSNESTFKANRFYLLTSAFISLVVPLINIPGFFKSLLVQVNMGQVIVYKVGSYITSSQFSYSSLLAVFYIAGVCIAAIIFIKNILQISFLIFKSPAHKEKGYTRVYSKKAEGVFSFLKFMVIPSGKPCEDSEVIEHELTHIRQMHSLDVLFFELLSVLFWYNPVCYLYKSAAKENHEFLADDAVVQGKENRSEYAKRIMAYALNITPYSLPGNFIYHSFLRRRIIMLAKQPSDARRFASRYAASGMLLLVMITLTSFLKDRNIVLYSNVSACKSNLILQGQVNAA